MTDLGPVSTSLYAELRELARQRGIVVWLDKEGSYTAFADELAARSAREPTALPVRRFRGSYLEVMLAHEDLQDGVAMTPLVIHVPGHTEDSIAETPLFELYKAGRRHRRALDTLVRDAAHGLATPAAIEAFVSQPGLTLEGADRWLARQSSQASGTVGPDLSLHTAEALYDDLVSRGPVARELERPEAVAAVWHRAEVLLGLTDDARRRLLAEGEDDGATHDLAGRSRKRTLRPRSPGGRCARRVRPRSTARASRPRASPRRSTCPSRPWPRVQAGRTSEAPYDKQYASIASSIEVLVPLEGRGTRPRTTSARSTRSSSRTPR
ncbi:MAG: hypothetical protein IPH80_11425 [Myxococcales bacterium]|nr:hypothetical protein [Myxococcales bacterium]